MKNIKKVLIMSALAVMTLSTTVFAGGFGGFRLPIYNGYNYLGYYTKANQSNNTVYFQLDKLTNADSIDTWVTNSQKTQVSNDYYPSMGNRYWDMAHWGNINGGYVGACNQRYTNLEAYADGWVNFN